MSTHDVIVVGARAAGAGTALLLARSGFDVLVVDRSQFGADTLSTHALMRGAVVQLNRWGLLDRIAATTPPIRKTVFRYADSDVGITIKPAHGVEALYAPRRTVLDPALVEAARAAGARVDYGVTVKALVTDGASRVVGVEGTDATGRAFSSQAAIVVGADGLRSTVARLAGAPLTHVAGNHGAVVYGYWRGLASETYEWAFRAGTAAGFIPTNDGLTCVFAGGPPGLIGRGGHASLTSVLATASPHMAERLAAAEPAGPTRTFTGHRGFLRRAAGPGWALVGDAGAFRDPITAHGLTDSLRDAELLARAIIEGVGGGSGERTALREYEAIRNAHSLALLTVSDRIASYEWSDAEIADLHRTMNAAMAADLDLIGTFAAPASALIN